MLRSVLLSIVLLASLVGAMTGGSSSASAASSATFTPHWTVCRLHYRDPADFLYKRCSHYLMPKHAGQHPAGHTWREVKHTRTLSVRITFPTFAPPPVDMARAAISCAWGWRGHIAASSARWGVPTRVIAAVICVESRGRQYANSCVSGTDVYCSRGLMQLIPSTCAGVVYGNSLSAYYVDLCKQRLYDPAFNINAGTEYLAEQYRRFGYNWFNAAGAYNAGSFVNPVYVRAFTDFYY